MSLTTNDTSVSAAPAFWNFLALGMAVVASSGSVYLSVGLGLKACPLCFYQRTFAITAALVLAMLLWLDGARSRRAAVVALSLAVSGFAVAAFHVYLVQTGKLECPPAIFG
jgi:disulfide bond formation protein DsbB